MKRKNLFITAAAILGVALVVFLANSDFTLRSGDVAGTIGAADGDPPIAGVEHAERYRSQQIDDSAVSLDNPEIQELLQDDQVLRLVQDPAFQRALANEEMRRGLMSVELRRALLDTEFGRSLTAVNPGPIEGGPHPVNSVLLEEFAKRVFLNNAELGRVVVQNEALGRVLVNNEQLARAIVANEALGRALVANQDLQRLFASVDAVMLMAELQRRELFRTEAFGRFLSSEVALSAMGRTELRDAFFNHAAVFAN